MYVYIYIYACERFYLLLPLLLLLASLAGNSRISESDSDSNSDRESDSDSMMCIRYEPRQPHAMHMAAKHARTRHGTYSMGAVETWRAREAAAMYQPSQDRAHDFGRLGHRADHERSQSSETPCTAVTCLCVLDYIPYTHTHYR